MGKTGPACRVCEHEQRHLIELGLVVRTPVRVLSRRFSLSKDSIHRHRRLHMSPQLVAAIMTAVRPSAVDLEQLQRSESEGLLGSLANQRGRLLLLSQTCVEQGELSAAVGVERAITSSLELTSRLLGQLITHHQVTHANILITPDYLKLRQTIVAALKPFPEASRAVGAALASIETEAAETMASSKKPLLLEAQPC